MFIKRKFIVKNYMICGSITNNKKCVKSHVNTLDVTLLICKRDLFIRNLITAILSISVCFIRVIDML